MSKSASMVPFFDSCPTDSGVEIVAPVPHLTVAYGIRNVRFMIVPLNKNISVLELDFIHTRHLKNRLLNIKKIRNKNIILKPEF